MTDSGIRKVAALPANAITVAPVGIAHANFNTIAAALAFAVAGETILIFPGTYAESNLTLIAGVNLVGTDPDQCIISANNGVNPIVNSGVTCTISNLTIINQNAGQPAIRVTANTLTLRECRISGTGGGDAIQMTGGTLNAYDTTIVVGDIELSTAACTLAMYHCRANYIETTAAALAHSLTFEHCHIGSEICSNATGATTITLRHCSGITNISHAGTGTSDIYHCTFTNLNNTSTADWNIYESDVLGTLWNASTGYIYCVNCHVNDISCDNAGGTVACWGGLVISAIDCTGKVLWYVSDNTLRVLGSNDDMLKRAAANGAGKTIILQKGTYGISSTLVMVANCTLFGEGNPEDVIIEHGSNTNAVVSSNVLCSLTNITLSQSQNGPTLKVTGQTTTLRNCRLIRDVAGDSIVMTAGYLNLYDTLIREGDINLSTAICTLTVYHSQFQQVRAVSQIETAGAFAHVMKLEHCDLGGQNVASAATGATTLAMGGCTNVGTVSNLGTGTFAIQNSILAGATVNNALAIIRLRNCDYRIITRTNGNIVDESMALIDGIFKVIHKVWEVLTAAVYNSRTAGAGSITLGGAGQVLLKTGNAAADVAGLESAVDAAGALASSLTPARTIRYVQHFSASAFAGANGCRHFFGVRATLGDAFPAAAEQHAGFIWDGANFYASSSDGVAETTNLATPSTGAQHTLEVIVFGGVKVEFYVDGVLGATHSTRYPAAAMYWQELVHGAGTGAASACDTTLRRGRVQECPA